MAAVSVLPSPQSLSTMASRRVPLANNPNAANSPFRGPALVAGKRTRAQANDNREPTHGQPPLKKQMLDIDNDENANPRTLTRQSLQQQEAESRLFMRKNTNAPQTAFEKKLVAAREKKHPTSLKPAEKVSRGVDSLETIRQWQKHYKKAFPQFVFYFESVPEDVRAKVSRQVQYLGAKEEKFFSRSVTHIVTTRQIPADYAHTSPEDEYSVPSKQESGHRTIDPSLLDRPQDPQSTAALKRTTNLLDATLQSRNYNGAQHGLHNVEPRRLMAQGNDILSKARELGIKVWALEKLQRMMMTMYNAETGEHPVYGQLTRSHAAPNLAVGRQAKDADLQQLLRNEKVTGPADRDMAVAPQDMCQFRGYYLYIHDMNESTRPVMIRDYPKVASKEDGKWPQFRLTSAGRCPFIEDTNHQRKLLMQEQRAAGDVQNRGATLDAPRTRSRAAPAPETHQSVLTERQPNVRRSPRKQAQTELAKPLDPPKAVPSRQNSADGMQPLFGSAQANMRGLPRFIGGEPVASGLQPSNVTSAIRSQIISSTAISSTAPGARVGTSKEIHALKRKVLERGASVTSGQTLGSSYMNDMRAAINGEGAPAPRAAKRRAQEILGNIHEEPEGEESASRSRKVQQIRKKIVQPKELKPGYCENCRDKFEDFDEHIMSRKHRKFALAPENWAQLDELLSQLDRPLKDG